MSKVGIIGVGMVGRAAASAMVERGSCRELVLVDVRREVADAVALDLRYGIATGPSLTIRSGTTDDLAGADLIAITAGANEKSGGATDKSDAQGRLRLLDVNAGIFRSIVPGAVSVAPEAVLLVVADPPDPLADLTRTLAKHDRVVSTGTFLDSLRFATHLAQVLGVNPASVSAQVFGEHGMSEVLAWSAVTIAGVPLAEVLQQRQLDAEAFRTQVEAAVRSANINIIEGIGASQYGIGAVTARLTEAILRDERIVAPVGSYHPQDGVTYSLPSIVGAGGVCGVFQPRLSDTERTALARSVATLQQAAANCLLVDLALASGALVAAIDRVARNDGGAIDDSKRNARSICAVRYNLGSGATAATDTRGFLRTEGDAPCDGVDGWRSVGTERSRPWRRLLRFNLFEAPSTSSLPAAMMRALARATRRGRRCRRRPTSWGRAIASW